MYHSTFKWVFSIVTNGVATPIIISSEDWEDIHIAVDNFASDIGNITGIRPIVLEAAKISSATDAIICPGRRQSRGWVGNGYVIAGSDKRGTVYALYEHSEQFGVSPWY
ncbi:hypothetical protein BDZ89DRAFT_1052246, partial [Hymenopellis radicata]